MKKDRTPEEVLRAAVEVAVKAGWEKPKLTAKIGKDECPINLHSGTLFSESILFDHSFAKAFWKNCKRGEHFEMPAWEYHIKDLALSKDRLAYISSFL